MTNRAPLEGTARGFLEQEEREQGPSRDLQAAPLAPNDVMIFVESETPLRRERYLATWAVQASRVPFVKYGSSTREDHHEHEAARAADRIRKATEVRCPRSLKRVLAKD
jgi:hypothetical protein